MKAVVEYTSYQMDIGKTPLHFAADRGNTAIVDTLLAHGADVKAVDDFDRCTPLHWAAQQGHTAIVEALLAKGADAKAATKEGPYAAQGWTLRRRMATA